jgi:hypothetical protein
MYFICYLIINIQKFLKDCLCIQCAADDDNNNEEDGSTQVKVLDIYYPENKQFAYIQVICYLHPNVDVSMRTIYFLQMCSEDSAKRVKERLDHSWLMNRFLFTYLKLI